MPTDDDYGRRERLLLHQHTATQFGPSASPSSQSQAQPAHSHSHSHAHSHPLGNGHANVHNPGASPSGAPGPIGVDRFLQERIGQAEEHAAAGRFAGGGGGAHRQLQERYTGEKTGGADQQQQLPSGDGYGGQSLLQERYPQLPGLQSYHQFTGSPSVVGRIGIGGERFSHYGEQQVAGEPRGHDQQRYQHHSAGIGDRFRLQVPGKDDGHYATPGGVLLSSELFPSPPSPAPANDRFIPPPPLSPTPSEKYTSSQNLAGPPIPSAKERFASAERLLANASPVVGSQSLFATGVQPTKEPNRYSLSSERLLSASPIHAPVPERFACAPRVSDKLQPSTSPRHERGYQHLQEAQRYLSSSPNPEGAHQRYSSAERASASGSGSVESQAQLGGTSRRYSAAERATGSPGSCAAHQDLQSASQMQRYSGSAADRLGDILAQRYGQARIDRFVSAEHLSPGSCAPAERLLSSSSPSAATSSTNASAARYHASSSVYANSTSQTSPCGDHNQFSPTGDGRYSNPASAKTSNAEKYFPMQSKASQNAYGPDRYQAQSNQAPPSQDRTSRLDRFHAAANSGANSPSPQPDIRYSPGRSAADKSYLSLPKPKDRFPSTGRVVAPGSDRAYASAHTPVERYVPQPPPEILYPGYVDLYVPPSAHTPTDRYVPAADPGDPYMRRDLGFHHHYRLPPPGYPYHHQAHFRGFRGFAYAAPPPSVRLGGSPGSSSSTSSSNSAQREFSTSPLLRPKTRVSSAEFQVQQPHHSQPSHGQCCSDNSAQGPPTQRGCCPPATRRSLPSCAASMPTMPAQNNPHTSWQPSPGSGTTSTSTVSSSGQDGGIGTSQSISMYAVGATGAGNGNGNGNGNGSKISESPGNHSTTTSPPVPLTMTGNSNLARSASAPTGPRPVVTAPSFISHSYENQNQRLQRTMSRTEAIKSYIKRETATFFGVDEDSEAQEKQRWLERRRRMASRKYGALLPEHRPPDPDITRDVPDFADIPEGVTLRRWHQPVRRKDSVARMTLSGLSYMVTTMTRHRPRERDETRPESRSFPPSTVPPSGATPEVAVDEEEETFFEKPPPPSPASTQSAEHSCGNQEDGAGTGNLRENDPASSALSDLVDAPSIERDVSEELVRFTAAKDEGISTTEILSRRPRQISRDHYTSRTSSWRRSREPEGPGAPGPAGEAVTLRRQAISGTRISPNTIDRIFDNSNRRQYGMGIVGRFFGRSFRKSVAHKPDVKKQLDDIEDQRPFFTYWITTVQVLILVISLACYGFGPFGFELNHRSGLVLVTSLSLQQVDYQEPANFWIGPRAADLIHLGAKFAPCMRRDIKILKEIDVWRERERDTACCIRNDDSGCVQSSKQDCSNTISTWKKWGPGDSGPGGRISGSVCGLDPKFCDAPASIAPYEWPDDITKWPICRKTNPFNQRFSKGSNNQNMFPIGRHMDKMAEHMVCEVIGHPCCIGIHGMCRITTKEYCDFVHGYFHDEASLCSQVECLHDVCGMIPFLHPEWPDQFYRLFTSIFLHAGIFHLLITLCVQYFFMRDLEKLTGSLRIGIIYFTGGLAGNLASAIFVPYRAEVGPAGSHFALLATLVVEVLNSWPMLKHPRRALAKLLGSLFVLLLLGALPWIDNYAHLFGFVFGFLAAYAVMPFISFGKYDRRRKILLIWVCLILIIGLFAMLLALFYNVPVYECEVCKLFTCVPFTKDFCASQNINFKKEEPV